MHQMDNHLAVRIFQYKTTKKSLEIISCPIFIKFSIIIYVVCCDNFYNISFVNDFMYQIHTFIDLLLIKQKKYLRVFNEMYKNKILNTGIEEFLWTWIVYHIAFNVDIMNCEKNKT